MIVHQHTAGDERSPQPAAMFYTLIGRLAPGSSAAQALAQLQAAIDDRSAIDPSRRGHKAFVEDLC